MISEQQQELAGLYALGALPPLEREAFEAELSAHPELLAFTRDLQSAVSLVAGAKAPQLAPPPELRNKVLRRIDELEAAGGPPPVAPLAPAGLRFATGADQTGWKQLPIPGASIKLLSLERERGYAVLLGKLEPGASYPPHVNPGPEDFYILTGDLVIGDRKLVAGDFHHADGGSRHETNYSVEGCTLVAVLTTNDPLVDFALS
jgi:anti-sigma factor ChrR (cupin superfamily)